MVIQGYCGNMWGYKEEFKEYVGLWGMGLCWVI